MHRLFFLSEGTFRSVQCYSLPRHASYLTILPPYRGPDGTARFRVERTIPVSEPDACYRASRPGGAVGIPTPGGMPRGGGAVGLEERRQLLFYWGRAHGRAPALRRRLNELLSRQHGSDGDSVPRASFFTGAYRRSHFVLLPTGDYPLRDSSWRALREQAIPVYFSSCEASVLITEFPIFLPSEPPRFGANAWAVLLNQTAVMTNDTYLGDELRAIAPSKRRAMRACLSRHAQGFSFEPEPHADDAVSRILRHVLLPNNGSHLASC